MIKSQSKKRTEQDKLETSHNASQSKHVSKKWPWNEGSLQTQLEVIHKRKNKKKVNQICGNTS